MRRGMEKSGEESIGVEKREQERREEIYKSSFKDRNLQV